MERTFSTRKWPYPSCKVSHAEKKHGQTFAYFEAKSSRWPGNCRWQCFEWVSLFLLVNVWHYCSVIRETERLATITFCFGLCTLSALLSKRKRSLETCITLYWFLIDCVRSNTSSKCFTVDETNSGRNHTEDTKQREFPAVKRRRHRCFVMKCYQQTKFYTRFAHFPCIIFSILKWDLVPRQQFRGAWALVKISKRYSEKFL